MVKFEKYGIEETRNMSENHLQMEVGKISNKLQNELGLDKENSRNLVCTLMNVGIALQEKFDAKKKE